MEKHKSNNTVTAANARLRRRMILQQRSVSSTNDQRSVPISQSSQGSVSNPFVMSTSNATPRTPLTNITNQPIGTMYGSLPKRQKVANTQTSGHSHATSSQNPFQKGFRNDQRSVPITQSSQGSVSNLFVTPPSNATPITPFTNITNLPIDTMSASFPKRQKIANTQTSVHTHAKFSQNPSHKVFCNDQSSVHISQGCVYNPFTQPSNATPRIPLTNITNKPIGTMSGSLTKRQKVANTQTSVQTHATSSQNPSHRVKNSTHIHSLGKNLFNTFSKEYIPKDKPSTSQTPNIVPLPNPEDDVSDGESSSETGMSSSQEDDDSSESDDDSFEQQGCTLNSENQVTEYYDCGDPCHECKHCGATMWYNERTEKSRDCITPKFNLCCGDGKVQLPFLAPPPPLLQHLLFDSQATDSKNYQENTRVYNTMFAFTSPGMDFDHNFRGNRGPPTLRVQGQPCHRIGSMLPFPGEKPKFAQLYIYDTENEVANRMQGVSGNKKIDPQIVAKLSTMLDQHNEHAKGFRMARSRLAQHDVADVKLKLISDRKTDGRIYNRPTVSEVAALIVGDVDRADRRDIILEKHSGKLQRIDEFHPAYLGYQYPLLFPYGEDGYRSDILHRKRKTKKEPKRKKLTIKDWFCFRIMGRLFEAKTLLCSRRLFQQFLVDGYCMMESERLSFLRRNQSTLRVGKYQNLNQTQTSAPSTQTKKGKRVVLPSSFVGGQRYMDQLYFDGMAISSAVGFPDLFITFTCNPNWPEIQRHLKKDNLKPQDRPDIVTRVFKIKFNELLKDLTKKHVLGKVLAYMYTIEFQKRGLPHAHLLIFLHPSSKYPTPDDINKIISAEIPSKDTHPELYQLVKSHMMHGPCGTANQNSPCMNNGKCTKWFPKKYQNTTIVDHEGFPVYRRRSTGNTIEKNGIKLDNRFVVPYNRFLLLKYQAHINMEWCNQATSIKYLFKYINKGYDRIGASLVPDTAETSNQQRDIDEIKHYIDCRYISPCEACWRIFGYSIHGRKPAVERMFFHLLGDHCVYFTDFERINDVLLKPSVTESMFTSWFEANNKYSEARNLTYGQFVSKFVYDKPKRFWKPRKSGYTIGRLVWIPPSAGELYYLRMMLTVVKGPRNYDEIKYVNGVQYQTFREACYAKGFLEDDREFIEAIKEAHSWGSGYYLRKLFVIMLLSGSINMPNRVWNKTKHWLCDGILYQQRVLARNKDLQLTDDQIDNLTLSAIETLLQANRRSLKEFGSIPYPKGFVIAQLGNRLIYEERNYNRQQLNEEYLQLYALLTDEQREIFKKITSAVRSQNGGVFFLHGYGGTGKTFLYTTLASALRSKGDIVLTVATSGIASLLLPGGRTAHSKFKIPVPTLENSMCRMDGDSEDAELLRQTKLIIWDEAPMAHKYTFECLDRTLKDIMCGRLNSPKLFGGKVVVFGGDFRQILPVIPRGSRSDIVNASINASYIWDHCQVLTLTKNMRLQIGSAGATNENIAEFAKWILKVGEGKLSEPNDGNAEIEIPTEFLIPKTDNPIKAIVESTYPDLLQHYQNEDFLKSRAILASTIEVVDEINNHILNLIPGEEIEYLSSNSIDQSQINEPGIFDVVTPEFLSTLRTSGLPNHKIKLKIGTPIMLMRNLDQSEGLCNGTRLIITKLANHVLEARIISGKNKGNIAYIPRMTTSPSQSPWPFTLSRRQFPITVSYAMTINKSQGQSLANVGLYLPRSVFSHGQLYVALSRVKSKAGLKILINNNDSEVSSSTTNVVFKEVFQNV